MIQRGIGVEAGLTGAAAAERFARYRQNNRVLRILLEPQEQRLGEALENVASVESTLRALSLPHPFLLHGCDLMAWRLIEHAARNGYDTRAGLEDTRALPDGTLCRSNEELVAAARAVAEPCAP